MIENQHEHAARPVDERRAAAERMDRILDKSAAGLREVTEEEFAAALEAAMDEERTRDS